MNSQAHLFSRSVTRVLYWRSQGPIHHMEMVIDAKHIFIFQPQKAWHSFQRPQNTKAVGHFKTWFWRNFWNTSCNLDNEASPLIWSVEKSGIAHNLVNAVRYTIIQSANLCQHAPAISKLILRGCSRSAKRAFTRTFSETCSFITVEQTLFVTKSIPFSHHHCKTTMSKLIAHWVK